MIISGKADLLTCVPTPPAPTASTGQRVVERTDAVRALRFEWEANGWDWEREHMVALWLDVGLRIRGCHLVAIGSLSACLVHPRELFRAAVEAGAYAIVIAHNHPSGVLSPSNEDLSMTARMRSAGDILGIQVMDSLILGRDGAWNFIP